MIQGSTTIIACMLAFSLTFAQEAIRVNFDHLKSLTETIELLGDTVDIIHIYSTYPDYRWQDAAESGPEGMACVDDAARAAVVYLGHFELTGSAEDLHRAKGLLRFVMKMQAPDGQWYNFLFSDRTINTQGQTSRKLFAWWAARAVWALGTGYRVFADRNPLLAGSVKTCFDRALPQIDSLLTRFGQCDTLAGYPTPRWLVSESGADATSELLLGLTEYYRATRSARVRSMIEKLAKGLMLMQDRNAEAYTYGLFRSWRTLWHAWGNGQTQALAAAGRVLKNARMVRAAEKEARTWYSRLLAERFIKEIDLSKPDTSRRFSQISYDIRPIAVGLIRLYEATSKKKYLAMAGLMASWWTGNNPAGQPMYQPSTGRCFDGISEDGKVNLNSGAESTIEALAAMVELARYPRAARMSVFRRIEKRGSEKISACLFGNEKEGRVLLLRDNVRTDFRLLEGSAALKTWRLLQFSNP